MWTSPLQTRPAAAASWCQSACSGRHVHVIQSTSCTATWPPGRVNRTISETTASGSGTLLRTRRSCTRSNAAAGRPVAVASPERSSTAASPRASSSWRAMARYRASRSSPTTRPPAPTRSASRSSTPSGPQPRSSARSPVRRPIRSSSSAASARCSAHCAEQPSALGVVDPERVVGTIPCGRAHGTSSVATTCTTASSFRSFIGPPPRRSPRRCRPTTATPSGAAGRRPAAGRRAR